MKPYSIGIDLGGTLIKIGLVVEGKILAKSIIPAQSDNGLAYRLPVIKQHIEKLLAARGGVARDEFAGIGICFPGLANSQTGKVLSTNAKYDDATDVDIEFWAKTSFGGEFYIDNDARMSAVGEWKYGAAKGYDNSVTMTIGTGIGCGVIIEGRVLTGKHHQAGCLGGHMVVDYRGRRCSCGNIGCAEAMSSSFFLNEIVKNSANISSDFYDNHAPFDFEKIFTLAKQGDQSAEFICNECMDIWAANITNLIHAYDPEIVVLSGGIMRSADVIIPYLQNRVDSLAWTPWGRVKICASQIMDDAAILGVTECIYNK